MQLLDREAVLAAEAGSARLAAAVISGPIPWPARHATTYVRRPVIGGNGLSGSDVHEVVLLSLGTPGRRTSSGVSVGVCATNGA
jgi:hypothetical protein